MQVVIKRVDEHDNPDNAWCADDNGSEVVVPLADISNYTASGKTVPTLKAALIGHTLSGVVGKSWQLID